MRSNCFNKQTFIKLGSFAMMLLLWVGSFGNTYSANTFYQQQKLIQGVVKDSQGVPLPGVSVLIKGKTKGVATDFDGNFSIDAEPSDILVFSYVGFATQEVPIKGKTKLSIVLKEATQELDEIVVVGYGTMRKSDLTGAVASVKVSDAIKKTPVANVSDALQGRLAGVSITGGGDPSKTSAIRIRGINSISADSGPLLVVDGFIGGSLKNINPSDIQSIEVLKDASATAVYGSRGANGVILVTTKKAGMDKMNIDINSFINIKNVLAKPSILHPAEFAELANDYEKEYYNDSSKFKYTQQDIDAFKRGERGYSYIDNIFNEPGLSQNYDLSMSGRTGKTSFLTSFRYENTDGIIKKSNYQQYNWRLKVDTEFQDWLDLGANIWGSYSENVGPRMSQYYGLLMSAMNYGTTVEPKDKNGNYNNFFPVNGSPIYNPMGYIWELDENNKAVNNHLQAYLNFKIAKGLTFRPQIGITFMNSLHRVANNERSYTYFKETQTSAQATSGWVLGFLNTNTLNYIKEFNKDHRINLTGVFEQSKQSSYRMRGAGYKLTFPDLLTYNALNYSEIPEVESNLINTGLMSFLGRINYVFKDKYMVTASYRADGSAALSEKWDYFPSVAFAWDLKKENFMSKWDKLSQFKIRLGYGAVGNQAVEMYRIYSKMVAQKDSSGNTVYVLGRPAAEDLRWERNEQWNVGLDLGFYNGRLKANIDYYDKYTKDLLLDVQQPLHTGWNSLLKNAGAIRNKGVEVTLSAIPVTTSDWRWSSDLTIAHNKGVFEIIPTQNKMQTQEGGYENDVFRMIEGEKLGSFYGYNYQGVWKTNEVDEIADIPGNTTLTNKDVYKVVPGQAKYQDVNKDGKFNESDMNIIGCGQPTFNWGWNNTFNYKNIDFSVFVIGYHGFDIYNATRKSRFNLLPSVGFDVITPNPELLNRWTPNNENTDIPGFVNTRSDIRDAISSRFVERGDFIKIKSITLGYNLPQGICEQVKINSLRIYTSVQNPFLITNYSGLDPEATLGTPLTQGVDWGAYPNGTNYLFGINLSF